MKYREMSRKTSKTL